MVIVVVHLPLYMYRYCVFCDIFILVVNVVFVLAQAYIHIYTRYLLSQPYNTDLRELFVVGVKNIITLFLSYFLNALREKLLGENPFSNNKILTPVMLDNNIAGSQNVRIVIC